MTRGAILLAVALTLALSPAAAAGPSAAQPDLVIVGRDGNTFTGDNIYDANGVGEGRSVIVDRHITFIVQVENDGAAKGEFVAHGTTAGAGINARYFRGSRNVTSDMATTGLDLNLDPGAAKKVRAVVTADPDAALGTMQNISIIVEPARGGRVLDGLHIKVTKTSTPV